MNTSQDKTYVNKEDLVTKPEPSSEVATPPDDGSDSEKIITESPFWGKVCTFRIHGGQVCGNLLKDGEYICKDCKKEKFSTKFGNFSSKPILHRPSAPYTLRRGPCECMICDALCLSDHIP